MAPVVGVSQMGQLPANTVTLQKLKERCYILADVVKEIAHLDSSIDATDNQRQFIETMIGAAIWYMPQGNVFWSGKISLDAARAFHPDSGTAKPKLAKDRDFPRKVAAQQLLQLNWSEISDPGEELLRRYCESYGRFNLITSSENRRLMQFQKTLAFSDSTKAYQSAGIVLVEITSEQLAGIKLRDKAMISQILAGYSVHAIPPSVMTGS